jgi:hypothetical protein
MFFYLHNCSLCFRTLSALTFWRTRSSQDWVLLLKLLTVLFLTEWHESRVATRTRITIFFRRPVLRLAERRRSVEVGTSPRDRTLPSGTHVIQPAADALQFRVTTLSYLRQLKLVVRETTHSCLYCGINYSVSVSKSSGNEQ